MSSDTRSTCSKCGAEFWCGGANDHACWCMQVPDAVNKEAAARLLAVTTLESPCLCPTCLDAVLNGDPAVV